MINDLEIRTKEANEHTENVKKYLKENGLLLRTDIPLEENEKFTKTSYIPGSDEIKKHVVIGTDLIEKHNEEVKYLTGNVELPDNMAVIFGTAAIPPHYLNSTNVIDHHTISNTKVINKAKSIIIYIIRKKNGRNR